MTDDFTINGISFEETIKRLEDFMDSEYFKQGPHCCSNIREWKTLASARDFLEWMREEEDKNKEENERLRAEILERDKLMHEYGCCIGCTHYGTSGCKLDETEMCSDENDRWQWCGVRKEDGTA